jgi:hypothetical protein
MYNLLAETVRKVMSPSGTIPIKITWLAIVIPGGFVAAE